MPRIAFDQLPDDARLWVFAAAAPVTGPAAEALLAAVDRELDGWRAHGIPLVCARDWRDDRFLAVAADERATDASGCSVDALYNAIEALESSIGTTLTGSGEIYWRDTSGVVQRTDRPTFRARAAAGEVGRETLVFDTAVITAGAWRTAFEKPARESWHARLMRVGV
jgi:hypothetical protein